LSSKTLHRKLLLIFAFPFYLRNSTYRAKNLKKAVVPLRSSEALLGLIFLSNLKFSLNKLLLVAVCVSLVLTVIMLIKDRGTRREAL
jgi:hypothetical protein